MEGINPILYDLSQMGIQFGPDFEGEGKTNIKFQLSFSEEEIQKQIDYIKTLSKNPNELVNALVLQFPVDKPENKEALAVAFEGFLKNKGLPGRVEREVADCLLLVLKLSSEKEEAFAQPLKFLLSQGLNNICQENQSFLTLNLSSASDFKDLLPYLADNESIVCTFLQSSKLEVKLALAKNLIHGLSQVFTKIDPEFIHSPPMMILKYFKNVDIDLRFQSTKELPQNVRNILFYPEFLRGISEESRKLKINDPNSGVILEKLGSKVTGFLVIPELLVGKIDLNLPNTSIFVKEYFGLMNYF